MLDTLLHIILCGIFAIYFCFSSSVRQKYWFVNISDPFFYSDRLAHSINPDIPICFAALIPPIHFIIMPANWHHHHMHNIHTKSKPGFVRIQIPTINFLSVLGKDRKTLVADIGC